MNPAHEMREKAVAICIDMANRYDEDIEGCDGDELIEYSQAIALCFRLAYIIRHGKQPPKDEKWAAEFSELSKNLPRDDSAFKAIRSLPAEGTEPPHRGTQFWRKLYFDLANEVEQRLGQALGFPWFKDDQKNFPGATEAEGVCIGDHVPESILDEAAERIKRTSPPAKPESQPFPPGIPPFEFCICDGDDASGCPFHDPRLKKPESQGGGR